MTVGEPLGAGARERPTTRGPVLLGCGMLLAVAVLAGLAVSLCVVFVESGADTGAVVLDDAAAYAPDSATFIGEQNFYLVRLRGRFLALWDLDAANRAAQGRRCRAAPIPVDDPSLGDVLDRYGARMSAEGGGTLVFREGCNGALYDAAGIRIDRDGPNLDRLPVHVRPDQKIEVATGSPNCTERTPDAVLASRPCAAR